jgi:succinate dehydrogenase / fumarate reductase membrane anchor subunit
MVKSVLSNNHAGLRDWLIQRLSAVIMAFYFLSMITFFVLNPNPQFYEWQGLFTKTWFKIASILFFLALVWHAWVGMWTIYTDYVKCYVVRLILHTITLLSLLGFFLALLLILWGV